MAPMLPEPGGEPKPLVGRVVRRFEIPRGYTKLPEALNLDADPKYHKHLRELSKFSSAEPGTGMPSGWLYPDPTEVLLWRVV